MTSIIDYLNDNFHYSSPNYENALNTVNNKIPFNYVIKVRGDGNCLIRSIIGCLFKFRSKDDIFNILSNFTNNKDKTNLRQTIFNNIDIKKIIDIQNFIDSSLVDQICFNIRERIKNDWNKYYKGCYQYHMDDNCIDGLAREFVMKLLEVDVLFVYSLNPGKDEDFVKRIEATTDKNYNEKSIICLICAQGFCHYSSLVN